VSAGRAQLAAFAPEIVSERLCDVLRSHGVVGSV